MQPSAKLASSSPSSRPDSLLRKPNRRTAERKKHVVKSSNSHRGPASELLDLYAGISDI